MLTTSTFITEMGTENISKEFLHRSELLVASSVKHKFCWPVLATKGWEQVCDEVRTFDSYYLLKDGFSEVPRSIKDRT